MGGAVRSGALEALASGTPAIAFPRGAATEIIRHGENGALVGDIPAMTKAIRRLHIDPMSCRRSIQHRFDVHRMVSDYESLFFSLLRRTSPPAAA